MRKFVSFSLTLMLLFSMIPMNISVLTVFASAGGGGGLPPSEGPTSPPALTPGPFTLTYAPSTSSPAFPKIDIASPAAAFISPYHFHGAAPTAITGLNDNDPVTVTGRSDELLLGLHLRGYTFQGWTEDEDWVVGDDLYVSGDAIVISGASVVLYSVWALDDSTTPGAMNKAYTVEYNLNGGSGTTPAGLSGLENFQHFTPDAGNALSKEGYVFLGWSQNKDATLPDPQLGGTYAIEDQNDMTLYAIWSESTYDNLYASVRGETNAAAAYKAFAKKAYQEGYPVIAQLFLATADAEAKHANDEWAILAAMGATDRPIAVAPVVGTTEVNLKTAFDGETYEYTTMYPGFLTATEAESVGLTGAALTAVQNAARIFTRAGKAEQVHAGNYKDILDNFDNQDYINNKYKVVYRCFVCGEVVTERPANCPICNAAGSTFAMYDTGLNATYFNLYDSVQGETNANAAYLAFAAKADEEGYPAIARLFRATADAEFKHANDEWTILENMGAIERPTAALPTVSTTAVNLQAAFDGETYEYTTMYALFLETAQDEGMTGGAFNAARIFTLAGKAEQVHAGNFKDVLDNFDDQDYINNKYKVVYRCLVCGEVVTERPTNCPICYAAGSSFIAYGVYTVTFDLNGGAHTGGGDLVQAVFEGEAALAPTAQRSNYKFDGWDKTFDNITANITVSAIWTQTSSGGSSYSGGSGSFGGGSASGSGNVDITGPSTPLIPEYSDSLYSDVSTSDWFNEAVRFATERGLMTGTGSGQFSPNGVMTRAMLVTVLYRLEGSPSVTGDIPFSDVGGGDWYSDAILWASENGVVEGYNDGRFGLNDPVTREQAVTILYRYAMAKGLDVSASADLSAFSDMSQISDWAKDAMSWAVAEGIIQGRTATTIEPAGISTRAEVATILMRYIEDFMGKAGDTSEPVDDDSDVPADDTDDTENDTDDTAPDEEGDTDNTSDTEE